MEPCFEYTEIRNTHNKDMKKERDWALMWHFSGELGFISSLDQ